MLWATQIRKQVELSFDRLITAILAGTNRYKSLEPAEVTTLLGAVDEHRAKVLFVTDAAYFLDHWQDPVDRVQRLIHGDLRWQAIVEARAARHPRPDAVVPVRYMGFDDAKGVRIFKFGRLPVGAMSPVYTVQVAVDLLLKHGISFQDGPAMCSAIMAAGIAESHQVTDEDCLAFVALRPARAERKAPRKKPVQQDEV
ncbi:MAG: hypothetical protein ABUS49_05275 [Acidobacteriota bacterium]